MKIPVFGYFLRGWSNKNMYHLYILECADKTLYTGITVDLERRIKEHNHSKLGAKYPRAAAGAAGVLQKVPQPLISFPGGKIIPDKKFPEEINFLAGCINVR